MKEIIAVIRRGKASETEAGLHKAGVLGITIISAEGRGKEHGEELPGHRSVDITLSRTEGFVPKVMLWAIVEDDKVKDVVDKVIKINHTGKRGDGKIFVCPIDECMRLRTGERGDAALA